MQTPEYVGSSAARMIAGLALFMVLVVGGVWFLTLDPTTTGVGKLPSAENTKSSKPVKKSDAKTVDAGDFFYQAIGAAPEGEAAPRADLKLSYTLELKVAASKDEAEALIDDLSAHGVEAYYTPLSRQGHVVYRVRRGVFPTQKAASQAALALREQHKVAARVVKLQ